MGFERSCKFNHLIRIVSYIIWFQRLSNFDKVKSWATLFTNMGIQFSSISIPKTTGTKFMITSIQIRQWLLSEVMKEEGSIILRKFGL